MECRRAWRFHQGGSGGGYGRHGPFGRRRAGQQHVLGPAGIEGHLFPHRGFLQSGQQAILDGPRIRGPGLWVRNPGFVAFLPGRQERPVELDDRRIVTGGRHKAVEFQFLILRRQRRQLGGGLMRPPGSRGDPGPPGDPHLQLVGGRPGLGLEDHHGGVGLERLAQKVDAGGLPFQPGARFHRDPGHLLHARRDHGRSFDLAGTSFRASHGDGQGFADDTAGRVGDVKGIGGGLEGPERRPDAAGHLHIAGLHHPLAAREFGGEGHLAFRVDPGQVGFQPRHHRGGMDADLSQVLGVRVVHGPNPDMVDPLPTRRGIEPFGRNAPTLRLHHRPPHLLVAMAREGQKQRVVHCDFSMPRLDLDRHRLIVWALGASAPQKGERDGRHGGP